MEQKGITVATVSLRTAEDILARDGLFADSAAIEARNLARYRLGLSLLAARDTRHADVLHALSLEEDDRLLPVLADPVLRNAFEDDTACLENGVFTASALGGYLAEGAWPLSADGTGPCESLMRSRARPWPGTGAGWVWTGLRATASRQPMAERLLELCLNSFEPGNRTEPFDATPEMVEALRQGADLLTSLLPQIGPSVLRHVSLIGFSDGDSADGPLQSLSGGDPLPSAILMSPGRLREPWTTAETLLHEAAHLKLFDVLRSCSLVEDGTARVPIPWRQSSWSFIRVLVALHFYAHLTVFQSAAREAAPELVARYGTPLAGEVIDEPTPGSPAAALGTHRTVLERLTYLAEQALCADHGQVTPEGRRFVHWLLDAVEHCEPGVRSLVRVPPPATADPSDEPHSPDGVFVRNEPVLVRELPALRQLLVLLPDQARFHWLDAHTWTVYALCEGASLTSLAERYRRTVHGPMGEDAARRITSRCLDPLLAAGLVSRADASIVPGGTP
ncbi:HEXXH motif-containing putative peptide modification protein [Streptomyces sp. NPDC059443]|uniref:aKG-HExxH-type peptide beta-hydroxylase n=1 Tax=unclassified Streptomyces TaxID=2593676 RepID=UPI0036C13525